MRPFKSVRHAAARSLAAGRRRSNAEVPDRRAWSGVRLGYWERLSLRGVYA